MIRHKFLRDLVSAGDDKELSGSTDDFPRVHIFDQESISAVDSALAARRPLLIRGEPGIGKSQLAEAVAAVLGRAFRSITLDAHTESRDLQWTIDAVQRLADAQLCAAAKTEIDLSPSKYIKPGILWWAFSWDSALKKTEKTKIEIPLPDGDETERAKNNGVVALIDEIDKASSAVPNGLLEALAMRQISPPGYDDAVRMEGIDPLIIVTTNDFRPLPPAFLRRCFVMTMDYPSDREKFITWLVERASKHFPSFDPDLLKSWAEKLFEDRDSLSNQMNRPGLAEYLDLLRAAQNLAQDDPSRHAKLLEEIAPWTLKKHHPK